MMGMEDAPQREALTSGALIRARPDLSTLVVNGDDRLTWLAGMLTGDVKTLSPGQGAFSLSVNKTGKVQAEVWVLVEEDRVLLGVPRTQDEELLETLDRYLIMEDAELALDRDRSWWVAHGPEASAVVEAARGKGLAAGLTQLGASPTAVVAVERALDANPTETLTLPPGAVLATPDGWEHLRIEHLVPTFGVDYGHDAYPQEARLEGWAVSFDKGCYLGQEAVFMLQKRGKPPKRLVLLALEGEAPAAETAVLTPEGAKVGRVTSATSHDGQALALAMVKTKHSDDGNELRVGDRAATIRPPGPAFHG